MVQMSKLEPSRRSLKKQKEQRSKLEASRKSLKQGWFKSLNLNQVGKV